MSIEDQNIEELDIEEVEDQVAKKLEECATFLLSCELEGKKCKKCKEKDNCLIFIRTVLSALCRIEIARMTNYDKKLPQQMFI